MRVRRDYIAVGPGEGKYQASVVGKGKINGYMVCKLPSCRSRIGMVRRVCAGEEAIVIIVIVIIVKVKVKVNMNEL